MPDSNTPSNGETPPLKDIQMHVAKVWKRARSNAFAHRAAAEYNKERAVTYFRRQIILGISAIMTVLILYMVSSTKLVNHDHWLAEVASLLLTLTSVGCSVMSLYYSIMQNYLGFDRLHQRHNNNQHLYLHISQRAREVSFPKMEPKRALAIMEDLERDFQLVKARGQEPIEAHWVEGNDILYGIQDRPEAELQSFDLKDTEADRSTDMPNRKAEDEQAEHPKAEETSPDMQSPGSKRSHSKPKAK